MAVTTGPVSLDITGQVEIVSELNRQVNDLKGRRSEAGMRAAGLIVLGNTRPLTPFDTGNLIGSSYSDVHRDGAGNWAVEIGFTASYAVAVHEVNRAYRKPGSQWKYLETGLLRSVKEILDTLQHVLNVEKREVEGVA